MTLPKCGLGQPLTIGHSEMLRVAIKSVHVAEAEYSLKGGGPSVVE